MPYQLIAFDMDGTLLNSQKEISEKNLEAIRRASETGKTVILSTGRCPAELRPFLELIPGLRYLNCISGALVYDRQEKKEIYSRALPVELVKELLRIGREEDVMPQLLTDKSIVQRSHWEQMDHYFMGVYKPAFGRMAEKWEDLYGQYEAEPFPVNKLNLYHVNLEARERTRRRIQEAGLPVEMVNSESTSVEISPAGVDKGEGLAILCGYLGIPLEETIAVGDGENDIGILKRAGLAVAMKNAAPPVLRLADVVVADCDHDGCAEAVDKCLLSREIGKEQL